ncbi:MAG: hypothetical protein IJG07_13610, partial [Prevotella sp.]|nr:hypothetical protein [Prevotella sp.]
GHTRWKAAKKLKLKTVPVLVADDLTEEQVRAYRIADNSTGELATWDFDLLLPEIEGLSYDMADFGMNLTRTEDGVDFSNLEQYKDQEHTEEYDAFLDKFKEKHTTDDCFTPPAVYDAIKGWVIKTYGLEGREIVRPFYPGGDYETYDYPKGCVVLDNPPFSILKKIVRYYLDNSIDFFIFADARTCGWYFEIANVVLSATNIVYDNGAEVRTAFITNMGEDKIRVSAELHDIIDKAQPKETADLQAYAYPDNLVTSMLLDRLAGYGSEFSIKHIEFIKKMDDGNEIFGGGALVSDAMAERVKAERVKAERVKIKVELSEREREIIRQLGEKEVIA